MVLDARAGVYVCRYRIERNTGESRPGRSLGRYRLLELPVRIIFEVPGAGRGPSSVDMSHYEMMKRSTGTHAASARASEGSCEVNQVNRAEVLAARDALPSDGDVQLVAEAFRVLANPNRLRVLVALEGRELCVCDLREVLGISMSGTSQVLRELRRLGAVAFLSLIHI